MDGNQSLKPKTGYEINTEPFTYELYEEAAPLLEQHWEEIGVNKDKIVLNPDEGFYFLLEEQKSLHCLIARHQDEIVGYIVTIVGSHPHYMDTRFGQNDILYIKPEHRKGMLAVRMMKKHEEEMKKLGVTVITYHMKPEHDFSSLLERMGHSLFEVTYRKTLE